jgi:hypothetical protein
MALAGKTSTQGRHVRCRNAGTLAAPWQQQPALAGARNSSTTCYAISAKISKRAWNA